jgi:S1-C subfamily serine protease
MKRTLVIVLAAALVGGLTGAVIGVALEGGDTSSKAATDLPLAAPTELSSATAPDTHQSRADLSPEAIYREDAPSVVLITDTRTQTVPGSLFLPPSKEQVGSLGSGFVIDRQGDVVTNDHVVQGAQGIRVGFSNGASYPATIVGADPSTDVAVVRVKAPSSALRPLTFDDSSKLQVGDPAYAIGNPFGLDRTMTAGIVSAVGRDIESPNGLTIPKAIQTDAPINHGNSGGPLLDRDGRVVGIAAQIQGGTVNANVGVGFAIPSDTARSVVEQLLANGHAQHAWLGISLVTIDPAVARVVRGMPEHGVIVERVIKGSPAAKAGLRAARNEVTMNGVSIPVGGDTIVAIEGKPVETSAQVADAVATRKPGDRITLEIVRHGAHENVTVALGNVPALS